MNLKNEIIGKVFGKLIVKEFLHYDGKHYHYDCICDCGSRHITTRNNLLRNITYRCNICAVNSRVKDSIIKQSRYTYNSYRSMILRCSENVRYLNVPICKEWLGDSGFLNFLEDMGPRPDNYTLDRIDNNKGYEPSNCRWSNVSVQNHNKGKRKDSIGTYIGVSKVGKTGKFSVQLLREGRRYVNSMFTNELDAATFYDNLSEQWYGDRPNNTVRREVTEPKRKAGGLSFDNKSKKYRVRVFDYSDIRKTVGYYTTHEEAVEVLELLQDMIYNR